MLRSLAETDSPRLQDLKQQKFTLEVEPTDLVSCPPTSPKPCQPAPQLSFRLTVLASGPHSTQIRDTKQALQISAVKEKISGEKGWDPKQQKLIYSGAVARTPRPNAPPFLTIV